jgi:hypothetical protein
VLEQLRTRLEAIHDPLDQRLEEARLRAGRMAIAEAVRLEVRHRGQASAVLEGLEEVGRVLDVGGPLRRIAHDRRRVLERIADIAVPVAAGADEDVEEGEVLAGDLGRERRQPVARERMRIERRRRRRRVAVQLVERHRPRRRAAGLRSRQERRVRRLARIAERLRADEVRDRIDRRDLELIRGVHVPSRRAIGLDDSLGQQIQDVLAGPGHVGAVEIVERAVLSDDHDHMLDRRRRVARAVVGPIREGDSAPGRPAQLRSQRGHGDPSPQRHRHRRFSLSCVGSLQENGAGPRAAWAHEYRRGATRA